MSSSHFSGNLSTHTQSTPLSALRCIRCSVDTTLEAAVRVFLEPDAAAAAVGFGNKYFESENI